MARVVNGLRWKHLDTQIRDGQSDSNWGRNQANKCLIHPGVPTQLWSALMMAASSHNHLQGDRSDNGYDWGDEIRYCSSG